MNEEYRPGELVFQQGIDADKWHIKNSYGNEVARVEVGMDQEWIVLWGPLFRYELSFDNQQDMMRFLSRHKDQIEWGEPVE